MRRIIICILALLIFEDVSLGVDIENKDIIIKNEDVLSYEDEDDKLIINLNGDIIINNDIFFYDLYDVSDYKTEETGE